MSEKRGYYEASKSFDLFHFPVAVLPGNVRYNGPHWHDHTEIILCKIGSTHLRIEGREYILKSGDFITIPGGVSHEIYGGEDGGLQIIGSVDAKALSCLDTMVIDCSTLNGELTEEEIRKVRKLLGKMAALSLVQVDLMLQKADLSAGKLDFPKERQDFPKERQDFPEERLHFPRVKPELSAGKNGQRSGMEENYLELFYHYHPLQEEENRFLYQAAQYQLLAIFSRHKKKGKNTDAKQFVPVKQAVRYIHEHLGEPLSAAVLAGQLHVSEPTVYRIFREQIGMNLNAYITEVRLEAACRYLQATTLSVTEIAYNCGFTGLSNFYRIFKEKIRMTPKEYRAKHPVTVSAAVLNQPDIMRMNQFEHFIQLGYPVGVLEEEDQG